MKPVAMIVGLGVALALGFWAGSSLASFQARNAVLAGPYSDSFIPAHAQLDQAITKLTAGDTNIIEHLKAADDHIERAKQWSERFIGQKDEQKR
jgi:hypothetical protein